VFVLTSANRHVRHCYERALEANERALKTTDPLARDEFLASEKRWLKLPESYELTERLTHFLKRPRVFPNHPMCPNCHVSMWLLKIQSGCEKVDFFYECKACDAKATVTDPND
jgi:DNA-directed RNA polymerase subunit M/transcription elongation factor TFIIS